MATQIQINKNQIRDLQGIRNLGAEKLSSLAQHLSELSPTSLNPVKLFDAIKSHLKGEEQAAESVMRQVLLFNGLMRQTNLEVTDVIAAVRSRVERDATWDSAEIEEWTAVEPMFRKLLCTKAFRLVATAIDLSYEYANLFRNARILTDIRPLFTDDADAIEGAVISYTLRLRFDSVDGKHEFSIAMDEGDVRDIAEQCERALKKAITARETMSTKVEIPTLIAGEAGDA